MKALFLLTAAVMSVNIGPASATVITYDCQFSKHTSPSGLEIDAHPFILKFIVDATTHKSYILGSQATSEVHAIQELSGGIAFIEVTDSGNVMTTAITPKGDSVHSRNSIMMGDLIPTQYYGTCLKH